MRRAVKILGLFALAPVLMGGGGINPPANPNAVVILSNVDMTLTVDPHPSVADAQTNSTSSGRVGQITLRRAGLVATETFELISPFGSFGPLALGCSTDPAVKLFRLGDATSPITMDNWVPKDVLVALFAKIGINIYSATPPTPPYLEPVITRIRSARCVQTVVGATPPDGILLVYADVGFYAEPGTRVPLN